MIIRQWAKIENPRLSTCLKQHKLLLFYGKPFLTTQRV